jgi:hypothetical protein
MDNVQNCDCYINIPSSQTYSCKKMLKSGSAIWHTLYLTRLLTSLMQSNQQYKHVSDNWNRG